MSELTKLEMQRLRSHLARLLPPGGRPLNAEEVCDVDELTRRLGDVIDAIRPREEMGAMVLEWRIPGEWALTTNSMRGQRKWILGNIEKRLTDDLHQVMLRWPRADLCCAKRRRWVQVRRFSPSKPDSPQCPDCIGAKQAIDRLTNAGILVDDSTEWIVRDSDWVKCKRGDTHVMVRIFEISSEGRQWPEPACEPPPRPAKKRGAMAAYLTEAPR